MATLILVYVGPPLGLADDADHVDTHGGAIAMDHPLGMTGARIVGTAARALATTCVRVGQGAAPVLGGVGRAGRGGGPVGRRRPRSEAGPYPNSDGRADAARRLAAVDGRPP